MQRQLTLGFVVVATVWLGACSDQEVDPRRLNPPIAMAGTGGGAGSGSMAQGGTGSGTGGSAGGGSAGTSSGPPPCTGCIEMVVPVSPLATAAMQQAMFNFVFNAPGVDMSNGTITFRARSLTVGADLFVTAFAQNGAPDYPGVYRPQMLLTEANGFSETNEDAWVNIVLDLANTVPLGGTVAPPPVATTDAGGGDAEAPPTGGGTLDNGGMDKSAVIQLGLQVGALATLAAPDTIDLLIDSVTFGGVDDPQAADREFDDNTAQGFTLTNYMIPPGTTGPTPH
ncbi:MAG TPA: hypothetical protein VJU61_27455 [Polyangiaceae bacterium]|nr:hypothetical protein [Polyangiaceae bacterium]